MSQPGAAAMGDLLADAAPGRAKMLRELRILLPEIQAGAARLDETAEFPYDFIDLLTRHGLLLATLPPYCGGLGFGEGATGAADLFHLLYLLGEASLPLARLYEAHVNAVQLILRYGTAGQAEALAADARAGRLFALWVTDPFEGGATLDELLVLHGGKAFCSGAGAVSRAVITAYTGAGAQMLVINLKPGCRVASSSMKLSGMRAATTGSIDLEGLQQRQEAILGRVGDYLREPLFSAGAWRGAAGALGGLAALIAAHRSEIIRRGRGQEPQQRARFGQIVIAHETARLWLEQAALRACLEDEDAAAVRAYVNLARLAVESACLDAMRHVQRGLGLSAFLSGTPAERIARDLGTYLRQPAPDEVLDLAAEYYMQAGLPGGL